MLIATRIKGERLRINDDIIITVLATGKGTVKLGVDVLQNAKLPLSEMVPEPDIKEKR